ncbi:MAG: 16S rRNA (guanine(527)-N(7))-methyltransferase RsmG [Thermomicrobiales bacterium]|nr:16S rRNA (guanine(527)-N(7))-methyltransferase RsmG [Thermomicrobiales bacterium]
MTATGSEHEAARAATATEIPDAPPWEGLSVASAKLGAPLPPEHLDRLLRYRDLLIEWNARFNLTALHQPDAIEQRLILDALRLLPAIDVVVADASEVVSLVDVGSGGGFPGLPIAICRPKVQVRLMEATGKKVGFLNEAIRDLGLGNARAVHGRAEDLGHDLDYRGQFDIATARAVASLPALIELTMPLLRLGGSAFFPKGTNLAEELRESAAACRALGAVIVGDEVLPGGETRLISVHKRDATPDRYPRRAGIPAREPIGAAAPGRTGRDTHARRRAGTDDRP